MNTNSDIARIMEPRILKLHKKLLEKERETIEKAPELTEEPGPVFSPAELKKLEKGMFEHTLTLLKLIQTNRYSSKSKIWEICKTAKLSSRKQFEASIEFLIKTELIEEVKIGNQTMYPLTTKGHDMLTTPLKDRVAIAHYEHDWHCQQIAEQLKARGYKAIREYGVSEKDFFDTKIQGKPVRVYNKIDVYAEQDGKHVAYEFINKAFYTLDFTVHKSLHHMNMDELVIVCKTLPDLNRAREKIESSEFWKKSKDALQGKVKYRTFNNIF